MASKTKKKKIKEQFSLVREYKKCWVYLRESRKFVHIIIGIFLLFALIAFFIPAPQILAERIFEFIEELMKETEGLSKLEIIQFIIMNNAKSTFFALCLGVLFGILPVVSAAVNGYLVGFVSMLSVNSGGILSLWRLLPHGIFELPAVFVSLGLGLRLGVLLFRRDVVRLKKGFLNSLRIFILIILPLLLIAGIIEGTLISLLN